MKPAVNNALTAIMCETVDYGGLLVARHDMYFDLLAKGVIVTGKTSPAGFAYMRRPAIDAPREWEYVDGDFRNLTTGQVIA